MPYTRRVYRSRPSRRALFAPSPFLWADDFWGEYAWRIWAGELGKALPPAQYPIVDVALDHPIFHMLYDVHRIPQIPSINFWGYSGGRTSERGTDSAVPHARAIND